jgi:hypothetical protein
MTTRRPGAPARAAAGDELVDGLGDRGVSATVGRSNSGSCVHAAARTRQAAIDADLSLTSVRDRALTSRNRR